MSQLGHRVLHAVTLFVTSFCMLVQPVLAEYKFRVPLDPIATGAEGGGRLTYSDTAHDFGVLPVGNQALHNITVTNTGNFSITLESIAATG